MHVGLTAGLSHSIQHFPLPEIFRAVGGLLGPQISEVSSYARNGQPAKTSLLSLGSEHTPNTLLCWAQELVWQAVVQSVTALEGKPERNETLVKQGGQKGIKSRVEGSSDMPRLYAVMKEPFAQGGLVAAVLPSRREWGAHLIRVCPVRESLGSPALGVEMPLDLLRSSGAHLQVPLCASRAGFVSPTEARLLQQPAPRCNQYSQSAHT